MKRHNHSGVETVGAAPCGRPRTPTAFSPKGDHGGSPLQFIFFLVAALFLANPAPQAAPLIKKQGIWLQDGAKAFSVLQKSNKPAVIHFWATWCATCKDMHPKVEALYKKYGKQAVFVFIDIDDPKAEDIVDQYDAWDIPLTVFENKKRKVVSFIKAVGNMATLQKGIAMALK